MIGLQKRDAGVGVTLLTFVFMVFRMVVRALPIAERSSLTRTTSFSAGRPLTLRDCIAFCDSLSECWDIETTALTKTCSEAFPLYALTVGKSKKAFV